MITSRFGLWNQVSLADSVAEQFITALSPSVAVTFEGRTVKIEPVSSNAHFKSLPGQWTPLNTTSEVVVVMLVCYA